MNEQPEKLDLTSLDIAAGQREKLRQIFPEAITEGGKVDFDRLKATLGEVVDTGKERYGMNWPGKSECFRTIQAPSRATLRPCREESVNFDTAENLIIEGDNLEALKLLQKGYLGKVKMIYIDPPYNTGNEFIYPDNYSESLDTYLSYTGQVDAGGRKFSTNTETDGRFHSKWMNMMYPRLFLARNLLREDGVIFISIDDHEVDNLRKLCNEVFGEDQFLAQVIVQSNKRGQTYKEIAKTHEYLLIYTKTESIDLHELEKDADALPFADSKGGFDLWELRNRNPKFGRFNRPNLFFPIYVDPKSTDECGYARVSLKQTVGMVEVLPLNSEGVESCWRWGKEKIQGSDLTSSSPVLISRQRRDGKWNIYEKSRKATTKAKSIWSDNEVISEQGTIELGALGLTEAFDHPKPKGLVKRCIHIASKENDIVLDFFGGSGTTAQAVLELNKEDGGNRKFILVQLPEPTGREDYKTIADITKERVRRVIQKISRGEEEGLTRRREDAKGEKQLELDAELLIPDLSAQKPDSKPLRGFAPSREPGFKVFKLDTSNFKTWDGVRPESPEAVVQQLELHVDHVLAGRAQEDILTELLLKSGFPLCTQVERMEFSREGAKDAKFYYSVEEGAMLICLEKDLTAQMVKELADKKPSRVICLDAGFQGSDQLKTNAVQTMKARGVLKFQTV